MVQSTSEVLKQRVSRYGNYLDQTKISRELLGIIAKHKPQMDSDQEDALMMFCVKISRILNGDPDYSDNWRDISGYATLVADRLDKAEKEYI